MRFINHLSYVISVAFISIFFTGFVVEMSRQFFDFGYYPFFDVAMGFGVAVFAGVMNYGWSNPTKVLTCKNVAYAAWRSAIMVALFGAGVYICRLVTGSTVSMSPVIAWSVLPYFFMEIATGTKWIMSEENEPA